MAIAEKRFPVIAINGSDAVNARIFTLIHEFIHLMLGASGISDLRNVAHPRTVEEQTGQFCNQVAGEILVPHAFFLTETIVQQLSPKMECPDSDISSLAHKYGVGREVVVRRLFEAGKAKQAFYQRQRQEHINEMHSKKTPGFTTPSRDVLRRIGPTITRIALEAYHRGQISGSKLADLLGTRLKQPPKIQAML
jgi:Zn-dependent peptidase ImmA (M78 family)